MTASMIRHTRILMLLGFMSLVSGCMYDPYTGTYYPCCANPYPYYTYPGYAPPYGYTPYYPPYGYAPQPGYPPPPAATQPYGQADAALASRFAAANTTHDGRLTLRQAQAANWQAVARNFPEIDVERKGYVTLNEIRVWLETQHKPSSFAPG